MTGELRTVSQLVLDLVGEQPTRDHQILLAHIHAKVRRSEDEIEQYQQVLNENPLDVDIHLQMLVAQQPPRLAASRDPRHRLTSRLFSRDDELPQAESGTACVRLAELVDQDIAEAILAFLRRFRPDVQLTDKKTSVSVRNGFHDKGRRSPFGYTFLMVPFARLPQLIGNPKTVIKTHPDSPGSLSGCPWR